MLATKHMPPRPRIVFAHQRSAYADAISRHYGRLGWDTHEARSAWEARDLALKLSPAAVVLGVDLPDESGWLTCEKILLDRPKQRVVLVTNGSTPTNRCFAAFVGAAALVHEDAGIEALAEQIGSRLASAL